MRKLLLAAALSICVSGGAMAAEVHTPHWSYLGVTGAAHWGEMGEEFKACGTGKTQSPINIEEYKQDPNLPPILPVYHPSVLNIANNGHTLQVNAAPGSQISVGGKVYDLKQFHFHTPSEHYLDGAPYPMEVHFVHQNPDDHEIAVVGAMIKIAAHNKVIEGIWQNAPAAGGHRQVENFTILASDLLPPDLRYYKYIGSLTTPPCTEGVQWHLLQNNIEISEDQLRAFQAMFPVNARPVQPLNGRDVRGQ